MEGKSEEERDTDGVRERVCYYKTNTQLDYTFLTFRLPSFGIRYFLMGSLPSNTILVSELRVCRHISDFLHNYILSRFLIAKISDGKRHRTRRGQRGKHNGERNRKNQIHCN